MKPFLTLHQTHPRVFFAERFPTVSDRVRLFVLHEPNRSFFFPPFLHVKEQRGQKSEQRLIKEGFWGLVVGVGGGGVILLLGCLPAWWSPVCNTSPSTNASRWDQDELTGNTWGKGSFGEKDETVHRSNLSPVHLCLCLSFQPL